MNPSLKAMISTLLNKRVIGNKHTQEKKLLVSKTRYIKISEKKQFDKEYKELIKKNYFIRLKKRTGKSSDWHISLNPKKLKEIFSLLNK